MEHSTVRRRFRWEVAYRSLAALVGWSVFLGVVFTVGLATGGGWV